MDKGLLTPLTVLFALAAACGSVAAQVVVPATPKKFGKRVTNGGATGGIGLLPGNSSSTGVKPTPPPPPTVRQVVYFVLGEPRQWTSSDGRTLIGKIIAFEEKVTESTGASPAAPTPEEMAKSLTGVPTVERDGKIRILVGNKPFEVALAGLSAADQDYVKALQQRIKPPVAPPK